MTLEVRSSDFEPVIYRDNSVISFTKLNKIIGFHDTKPLIRAGRRAKLQFEFSSEKKPREGIYVRDVPQLVAELGMSGGPKRDIFPSDTKSDFTFKTFSEHTVIYTYPKK